MDQLVNNLTSWFKQQKEETSAQDRTQLQGDQEVDENEETLEDAEESYTTFPTHPAFTIPIDVRRTEWLGEDQYGVFAAEDIPPNTQFWVWTERVVEIHSSEIYQYIADNFDTKDIQGIRRFLRRGFVLPHPYDDMFCSNPTDAGSLMNHSSTPNCVRPQGTARWIRAGEELTCDYGDNGNPPWLVDLYHMYGMLTPVEIAIAQKENGGQMVSDEYTGPVRHSLLDQMVNLGGP